MCSGLEENRLEVSMAGSSHGHKEPVDRCGKGGAAHADGHCRRGLGIKRWGPEGCRESDKGVVKDIPLSNVP